MAKVTFIRSVILSDGVLYSHGQKATISDELVAEAAPFIENGAATKAVAKPRGRAAKAKSDTSAETSDEKPSEEVK